MQTLYPYSTTANSKLKNHVFKFPNLETNIPNPANQHYRIITLANSQFQKHNSYRVPKPKPHDFKQTTSIIHFIESENPNLVRHPFKHHTQSHPLLPKR